MKKVSFIPVLAASMALYLLISCNKDDFKPAELSNISIITLPAKAEYYSGEDLDLSGIMLVLSWDDGATEGLAFSDFANAGITCLPANGSTQFLPSPT